MLSDSKLKTDQSGEIPNCIWLRWQRKRREEGKFSDAPEIGLILFDAIRRRINIVKKSISVALVDNNDLRAQKYHEIRNVTLEW